ncbi:hypothetical protein [Rhizobium sp. WYJ-E13]|uniref:hypothetical protein n=1 Tax=Rhizobium sp. WYJ-E13 TaxID=2849093 RepID=UPI001C1F149C|nr:hypothetical protein [Rhizobium sp. WYJ-E13]QWW72056.1 hypothetical protein KQ933_25990 [Rhizobium sp. WYJ-E13]
MYDALLARSCEKKIVTAVLSVGIAALVTALPLPVAAQVPSLKAGCPAIGLQQGMVNTTSELQTFSADHFSYQMELASAFSARTANQSTTYCMLYEAENFSAKTGSLPNNGRVDIFYWDVVDWSIEKLESGSSYRQSLYQTDDGKQVPSIQSTTVYAFKNSSFAVNAYKAAALKRSKSLISTLVALKANEIQTPSSPADMESVVAQGEPTALAEAPITPVGAVWASGDAELSVATVVHPNLPSGTIEILVEKGKGSQFKQVLIPYARALATAKETSSIPALIGEFRNSPIDFSGGDMTSYASVAEIDVKSMNTSLYPIKQPVVLTLPTGGRTCFLAATFSPVPMPRELQTCNPRIVFGIGD